MSENVQIFNEGSFTKGDLTWGWQCFLCHKEETGFGNATTAAEGLDDHTCPAAVPVSGVAARAKGAGDE